MDLINLLSLSYPADSEAQKVFEARVTRFFNYSISNMLALVYGAFLITLVLYVKGAVFDSITAYFVVTTIFVITTFFISKYVERDKPTGVRLAKFLWLRVMMGCLIGLMYGSAAFLLPVEAAETGIYLLVMIYLVSISVAIFQYSVIPAYYILFNLAVYLPLSVYLLMNNHEYNSLLTLFLVSGVAIFFSKGLKISASEVNAIILNLALEKEIAEHVFTRKKLEKLALYDGLTKVGNRSLFKNSAEASLERAKNEGLSMALLYIDLNDFKYINDHFGHIIGDEVLIEAAKRIRQKIRSSDLVSRLGGDEFVVILENYNKEKIDHSLINGISNTLNEDIEICGHTIELRASIGTASYPRNGSTIDELLHAADAKMYQQKNRME